MPASWKGDDLSLALQGVRNSYEIYFNGVKLGGAGAFPPNYRDGFTAEPYSYTVPARHVRAVEGTGARILDTRKTTPGLRALEKQAVLAGGGHNHRVGLFDAMLLKENHEALGGGVGEATRRALAAAPEGMKVEVECATLEELDEALEAGATSVLLDNMSPDQMREAVRRANGRAETEASGGVNLETVRAIAETGVDWISVGALTHSAPALDLSLLLDPL